MKIIGEILKRKREERKLTYEEIHNDTFIAKSYLKGLEEGDIDVFPAEVYYLGFLKRYATYLRLNPDELVSMYYNTIKQKTESDEEQKTTTSIQNYKPFMVIAALVLIAVAAFLVYNSTINSIKAKPSEETPVQAQLPADQAKAKNPAPLNIEVTAVQSSWIKVLCDDKQLFQGIFVAGSKQTWSADYRIKLIVGYTTGVRVKLNGEPVDISKGAKQEVNELTFTAKDLNTGKPNAAQ